MLQEEWCDISGYEAAYKISSYGRVWSNLSNKELSISVGTHGYERVNLRRSGETKQFLIHRLVAQNFLTNTNNLPQVNHKDGNKTNNKVSNLEWCTGKENTVHAFTELGIKGSRRAQYGKNNPRSRDYKITAPTGAVLFLTGIVQFCEENNLQATKMYAVAKGRRKHHKGFKCEAVKSGADPA